MDSVARLQYLAILVGKYDSYLKMENISKSIG